MLSYPVRNSWIDSILGHIALHSVIIIACRVLSQWTTLDLHLMRRLPGTRNHLTDAPHGLRIAGHHTEDPQIMQDILSGDSLRTDTALGKSDIFTHMRIEMVADHQHIQVLRKSIRGKRHRRVCRRWQNIVERSNTDNIRRMPTTGSLGMIGMNGSSRNGCDGIFNKASLIDRICVNCHLHIIGISDLQARIDCSRRSPPVLVQLESTGPRAQLFSQWLNSRGITLAQEAEIERPVLNRLEHTREIPGPRCAGGRVSTGCRPCTAANHSSDTVGNSLIDLLRRNKVDMRVNTTSRNKHMLARNHLSSRAHDQLRINPLHRIRVASLADLHDSTVFNT